MRPEQIQEIIECLPKGRTKFYYFRDRYCLDLLSWFLGEGKTVAEVKRSRYARLLRKPSLRKLCARLPDGKLTRDRLLSAWPPRPYAFLLTLGRWGETASNWRTWWQMSRPGANLVLQMNFSEMHNQRYRKLIQPREGHPFECSVHPVHTDGRLSLGWARLDVDLDAGEALIEEIQNDWIRDALAAAVWQNGAAGAERWIYGQAVGADRASLRRYQLEVIAPYAKIWDEALLLAALWFLREELGVRRVYYHTFRSGNLLKGIEWRKPPRSLYTTLPRRFCFEETAEPPRLLAAARCRPLRKRIRQGRFRWFLTEL